MKLPWVTTAYIGIPPQIPQISQFGPRRPRDPKHRLPRVRFTIYVPGSSSGDRPRTDVQPLLSGYLDLAVSLLLGSRRPPSTQLFRPTEKLSSLAKTPTAWARNKTPGGSGHARLSAHGPRGRFGGIFLIFWGRKMFEKSCVQEALLIFLWSKQKRRCRIN